MLSIHSLASSFVRWLAYALSMVLLLLPSSIYFRFFSQVMKIRTLSTVLYILPPHSVFVELFLFTLSFGSYSVFVASEIPSARVLLDWLTLSLSSSTG